MKKRISLIIFIINCMLCMHSATAQTLHIESMATLHIEDAAAADGNISNTPTLYVQGDIQNNGTIQNNGELQLTGDLTNNGTYVSAGDDGFVGNNAQSIVGNFTAGNAFHNLILHKSATHLNAAAHLDIEEGIYLSDGVLMPNGFIVHLKNTNGNAVHSNAPSGSANNFIAGKLKQDIAAGQTYTFYNGDLAHGNQKSILTFSNAGGATELDLIYNSDSAGFTNIAGCGGLYNTHTGIWTISANGNSGMYDYNIIMEPGGANLAAISSGIYDASLKDGVFITDPCANTLGNYAANNLSSFSQFKIAAGNNVALPVTITSFTGSQLVSTDRLDWITGSEQNNAYFNLQHSTDAAHFTTIAKIDSKAPGGNSNLPIAYTFENQYPVTGHNYYRLEQTDADGKKAIHAQIIDLIRNEKNATVNIYPNPVKELLHVEFYTDHAATATVKISELSGRVIKEVIAQTAAGNNSIEVNLSELPDALYSVQIYENDRLLSVSKITKND